MKKRVEAVFAGVVVLMLFIFVCLVHAENDFVEKNIFKKAWENIKDSYITITGNAITGFVICGSSCTMLNGCPGVYRCYPPVEGQPQGGYCSQFPNCNPSPVCRDGICNGAETCSSCPGDCGSCGLGCGDGICNGAETCSSCPGDCGSCCLSCSDKDCGDNGCGVSCGECGTRQKCDNFKCVDNPLCKKNRFECGFSTKTGDCGKCSIGMSCIKGKCCDGCKVGEKRCKEGENNVLQICKKYLTCTRWVDSNCKEGNVCDKETKKCVACSPNSCEDYDSFGELFGEDVCGEWDDGCGINLNCGKCENGLSCYKGFCKDIACDNNQDCGIDGSFENPFCSSCDEYLHRTYVWHTCVNPGTYESECIENKEDYVYRFCNTPYHGCFNGECKLSACITNENCNSLNELNGPCSKICDNGVCKPSSSCIQSCQLTGDCKTPLDKEKCDDFNSCTEDNCNSEPIICSHSCSTSGEISGAPGTWGAVDWSETGAKIWTVLELINKFKNEELRKKENGYHNKNIENFDAIIEGDPELAAAIVYKEFIVQNRLSFVIFYDGSKEVDKNYLKKISSFIKIMSNPLIQGQPVNVIDIFETHQIKPQFLLIDISCKRINLFNKMQEIRNVADYKTYPFFFSLYYKAVQREVLKNEELKKMNAGTVFENGLHPIMPLSGESSGDTPNIGIAAYTNFFGNIITYVPNLDSWFEFIKFEFIVGFTFFGKKDSSKKDSFYNIANLGLGPKKTQERINNLEDKIQDKLDKLKSKIQPKKVLCE